MRQRAVNGAIGGAKTSPVTIETQYRLRTSAPEQADLLLGQRRAKRGNRLSETGFGQCDGVHIAFADNQAAAFAMPQCFTGRLVAVEHARFVK